MRDAYKENKNLEKKSADEQSKELERIFYNNFNLRLKDYYNDPVKSIFTDSEQRVYYYLNRILNKKNEWNDKWYIIAPKIRLNDFIKVKEYKNLINKNEISEKIYSYKAVAPFLWMLLIPTKNEVKT